MNKLLLYGGLAVGAYLLYNKFVKKPTGNTKPTGGGGGGNTGGGGNPLPNYGNSGINFGIPEFMNIITDASRNKTPTNFPNSIGSVIRGIRPIHATASK